MPGIGPGALRRCESCELQGLSTNYSIRTDWNSMESWLDKHGRMTNPTEEQQNEAFTDWYLSPAKEKYRAVRREGGGKVLGLKESYELFSKRWRPVGKTDTSRLPAPWC